MPTRIGDDTISVRLAVLQEGRILPWALREGSERADRRAWALSEVSVRRSRCSDTVAMDLPISLLSVKWIPTNRTDGSRDRIAPYEITSDHDSNPIVSFDWRRPDFDLAAHEFLIGLLAVAFPPKGERDWLRYFHIPPTLEELREVFQPYAAAFSLDGEGPRFLQDFSALEAEPSPVEALFIEAPGANTIKLNRDLFVKRERIRVLSRASTAMALYTLQQFAPSGGAGHRTSLRGGGPLVTLVLPGTRGNGRPPTLWQKLWLHVPGSRPLDKAHLALTFPWLAPTKTSAKKESMSVSDADPLQAFFAMPRRIRLVFETNQARRPCDLSGETDDVVVTGFVAAPWGVNYGVFPHPLTPSYKIKTDTLPVHTPEGRSATGNGSGSSMPAPMDLAFRRRPSSRRRRVCAISTHLTGAKRD